jgi:hypothetical protein
MILQVYLGSRISRFTSHREKDLYAKQNCYSIFNITNDFVLKFTYYFRFINNFKCKNDKYESCRTHQDLQILFRSLIHVLKFE